MVRTKLGRIVLFLFLLLLQALVFRRMSLGWDGVVYAQVFIYPLFILSLPIRMRTEGVLLLGFLMGICIDFIYMSPGVHAGALTAMAFFRRYVLNFIEPRMGYQISDMPILADQDLGWVAIYYAVCLGIHSFWFHLFDLFSFQIFFSFWAKTIFTTGFSWFCLLIVQFLFFHRS
jgi:hypothetical protein